MSEDLLARLRPVAPAAAFVGLLLFVVSGVDYIMTVWPLQPGSTPWRYGAVGLLGGFLLSPLLGLAMIQVHAALSGQRLMQRVVLVVALAGAVGLTLGVVSFMLDVIQLRGGVAEAERWAFDVGASKAGFKLVTGALALGWIALAARQSLAQIAGTIRPERSQRGTPLMVGEESTGGK